MTDERVVSDASPLIAFAQIERLELLRNVFDRLHVPPIVKSEDSPTLSLPDWISERSPVEPLTAMIGDHSLDRGEADAIALALQLGSSRIILDDLPARRLAQRFGLVTTGTLGVRLAAKSEGFVPTIRPLLEDMLSFRFHVKPDLYAEILRRAGEEPT